MQESNLNPSASGDNGAAHGIAQWRDDRLTSLRSFAEEHGSSWDSPQTQLQFIQHELETSHSKAAEAIKKAKTPEEAAQAFALYFERPKGAETGDPNKIIGMNGRQSHARNLYTYGMFE
jgi:hypothetical protein